MIKLIALDMDGTLLDSNKKEPEDFASWVISHPEIQVVISSGRQYYTLEEQFKEIADRLIFIAENGAVIFRAGEVIYKKPMSSQGVHETLNVCDQNPAYHPLICGLKSAYITDEDPVVVEEAIKYYARRTSVQSLHDSVELDDIFKVAIFIHDNKAGDEYQTFPALSDDIEAVLSGTSWIDVASKGIDKGGALKVLMDILGLTPDECMVFGDYLNDVGMMQAVTHSYAMANSHPDLFKIASNVTKYTNDEDGVMRTLKELFD